MSLPTTAATMKEGPTILPLLPLFLLPLLLLTNAQNAQQDNPFPQLPRSFSVMSETNYLETNSSVYSFGYYDYVNNRFRIEEHTQDAATVLIILPAEKVSYRLVVGTTNCTSNNYASDVSSLAGEFFVFVQNLASNFSYAGYSNARGIYTQIWNVSYAGPDPTIRGAFLTFNMTYHFSVPDWNIRAGGSDEYRIPIKAQMDGTSKVNGTDIPISRQYHFMDFFYGTFDPSLFSMPYACMPKETPYSKSQAITAGGVVGVVVAGVIIVAAVVGRLIYLRRHPSSKGQRLADDAVL